MRVLFVLCLFLTSAATSAAQIPTCSVVPGWQQQGAARSYTADNLFEYMDGNAEGYLVFQFNTMNGVTCQSGGDAILIDISEMADAEYAYGMFAATRDPRQPLESIGMGGQVLPRRAIFAKGKYYVEMAANPDKDHHVALRAFALALEKQLTGLSTPPAVVHWFPQENLVPDSVRLVPESVLGLRMLKRGYVGQYSFGKGFLVEETSSEAAASVMGKLKERIGETSPANIADEAFTGTDKYLDGLCVFRKGKFVGGFANLKGNYNATTEAVKLANGIR